MNDKVLSSINKSLSSYENSKLEVMDNSAIQVTVNGVIVLSLVETSEDCFYLESCIPIDKNCIQCKSMFYCGLGHLLTDLDNVLSEFQKIYDQFYSTVKFLEATKIDCDYLCYKFELANNAYLILSFNNQGIETKILCIGGDLDLPKEMLDMLFYVSKSLNTKLELENQRTIEQKLKEIRFFSE